MKILSTSQVREADEFTIANEPVSSLNLMERAAQALHDYIIKLSATKSDQFTIFCGKGNNGGDGLALSRLLLNSGYTVITYILEYTSLGSKDFEENLISLQSTQGNKIIKITDGYDELDISPDSIVVDAIFGSGLNRAVDGWLKELIGELNKLPNFKVAIDIPSGLFADDNAENNLDAVYKTDLTLCFQSPKLAFFHLKTRELIGEYKVLDIQLHPEILQSLSSRHYLFEKDDALEIYRPRKKHSYKGTYGHSYLIAGSQSSMGAALLAAKACLRAGSGLLTVNTVKSGLISFNSLLPEAMVNCYSNDEEVEELGEIAKYSAIGIGPGLGTGEGATKVLKQLIQQSAKPLVLDADALNILAENKTWLAFLPKGSILTPHIGEFKRLIDADEIGDDYLDKLKEFSMKNSVITVLKDSITTIAGAGGNLFFVDSGSPALATAGSGDVLTGIILGLLAQGYNPIDAVLLATYLHGRAGSLSGEQNSVEANISSDTVEFIGKSYKELQD